MSYKRDRRHKQQRHEHRTEPKWSAVTLTRGRDVQIAYHPLGGLRFRGADTAAHLRKLRLARFDPSNTLVRQPLTMEEAADKIAVEYGQALAELADQ